MSRKLYEPTLEGRTKKTRLPLIFPASLRLLQPHDKKVLRPLTYVEFNMIRELPCLRTMNKLNQNLKILNENTGRLERAVSQKDLNAFSKAAEERQKLVNDVAGQERQLAAVLYHKEMRSSLETRKLAKESPLIKKIPGLVARWTVLDFKLREARRLLDMKTCLYDPGELKKEQARYEKLQKQYNKLDNDVRKILGKAGKEHLGITTVLYS